VFTPDGRRCSGGGGSGRWRMSTLRYNPPSRWARWRITGRRPGPTWSMQRMGAVSGWQGTERRMLSEAETQRLRAAVHTALATREYARARATLQELAQRSQGTGPGGSPRPAFSMAPLLNLIIATGLMFVVTGLIERESRYGVAG